MLAAKSQDTAVFPIALTEEEQRVVNAERDSLPMPRQRFDVGSKWLLHNQGRGALLVGGLRRVRRCEPMPGELAQTRNYPDRLLRVFLEGESRTMSWPKSPPTRRGEHSSRRWTTWPWPTRR
jgi:hypothetical protein